MILAVILAAISMGCSRVKDPQMMLIKGGCFEMGDASGEGDADERPVHRVCLDDYYLGVTEITQDQWQRVMGSNPSPFHTGGLYPVESVSWEDTQEFILLLNRMTGKHFRLPTEAEWEYAAREGGRLERGGTKTRREPKGPWLINLASQEGFRKVDPGAGPRDEPMPVRSSGPNSLGLYDMTGNLWEWVADWYDAAYYGNSVTNNPRGPASGQYRVIRGGSWGAPSRNVRATNRNRMRPSVRLFNIGLRLACSVSKPHQPVDDKRQ